MSTYNRVATWNMVCGKNAPEFGTTNYYEALGNQAARIAEELQELIEAIANCKILLAAEMGSVVVLMHKGEPVNAICNQETIDQWNQEILDAGCDLDVVVAGTNFLAGHDYEGAIDAVLSNNDVKYTYVRSDAETTLLQLNKRGKYHHIVGVKVKVDNEQTEDELRDLGYTPVVDGDGLHVMVWSVHRISDDKICKLLDHPKVDLSPFMA